jgi:hypothetical protein
VLVGPLLTRVPPNIAAKDASDPRGAAIAALADRDEAAARPAIIDDMTAGSEKVILELSRQKILPDAPELDLRETIKAARRA